MMRVAEIDRHIATMNELSGIVGAMRSLASMRVQEAQRVLPGIRRYAESVAAAIATALALLPQSVSEQPRPAGRHVLILCAGEHGFVGGFNERLVAAAIAAAEPAAELFVLGTRGALLAEETGRRAAWTAPMATRLASVPVTIQNLSAALYARIAEGRISRVEIVFTRYRPGSLGESERRLLLPVDLAVLRQDTLVLPPLHNLEPALLLERVVSEYMFALLTEAAVESIASENAARFAAMESAHDNVAKKLDELRRSAQQARQSEITTELLDLMTGAGSFGLE
jgi:F-type H+-transporting ATPase subunit gamma